MSYQASFQASYIMECRFADLIRDKWWYIQSEVISPSAPFPYYDVLAIDTYWNIDTFEVKWNKEDNFLHLWAVNNGQASTIIMTKSKYWVQQTETKFRIFKTDRLKAILANNHFQLKDKEWKQYWDIGNKLFNEFIIDEFEHWMKPTEIFNTIRENNLQIT